MNEKVMVVDDDRRLGDLAKSLRADEKARERQLAEIIRTAPNVESAVLAAARDVWETHPHITEVRFPEQCAEFKSILDGMYRVHLDKNADYSPMNILATGMVGLMTRIWDKVARLMNLTGFNIQEGTYGETKEPKNESVEDSLLDLANYAVIALILRRGKWGK